MTLCLSLIHIYIRPYKTAAGKSAIQTMEDRFIYGLNPEKLGAVSSYLCDPNTAPAEFLLVKSQMCIRDSTYPCEDRDMLAAEAAYCALEDDLQHYLDTYESTHDYDEYLSLIHI